MTIPETVRAFFDSYFPSMNSSSSLLVACSGGPDSMGLLAALKEIAPDLRYRIHVGHVNHKLRGRASEADAHLVKRTAQQYKWPFHQRVGLVSKTTSGNLEEKARVKRYEALVKMAKKHKCSAILTAHTLDDQIETMLMNMSRGAGPDGLGGMAPARSLGPRMLLCRPFLSVTKKSVLGFVRQKKVMFRLDSSNSDQALFRNWIRTRLVPVWEKRAPGLKQRMATMGAIFREEQTYWKGVLTRVEKTAVRRVPRGQLVDVERLSQFPLSLQRRLLRRIVGSDLLTFGRCERLIRWMTSPPTSGRHFQLKKGWVVERLSKSKGHPSSTLFVFENPLGSKKSKRVEKYQTKG